MSKSKPPKKKVVVTTSKETDESSAQRRRAAAPSARGRAAAAPAPLVFGRQTYILMAAGAGLVALGLLLMSGGAMPSPDVWEPERIYSFRRTVLAPAVIIAGLVVEIVAIFKRPPTETAE